jgi:predicted ATPase
VPKMSACSASRHWKPLLPRQDLQLWKRLATPAVQLFVERAAASAGGYELKDEDVPVVAQICRRLDGIALESSLLHVALTSLGFAEWPVAWTIDFIC